MRILDHRLLVVAGKGGVGKSTVSAALALAAAERGKKVLCCEINTRERIAPLLGARPSGPIIQEAVPGIFTANIRPKEALREYAIMKLKFDAVYKVVFENRVVRRFIRLIPSLAETVMLGKVWYEVEARNETNTAYKWDLVILDAPATGHSISLLRVPRVLMDTVPPGPMRDEAVKMQATLGNPEKTRINIVSLPEDMPVNETVDLARIIRSELDLPLGYIFLNGFVERRFSDEEVEDLLDVAERTPLWIRDKKTSYSSPGFPSVISEGMKLPEELESDPECDRFEKLKYNKSASKISPEIQTDVQTINMGDHLISPEQRVYMHPAVAAAQAALHHASRAELSAFYDRKLEMEAPHMPRIKLPRLHSRGFGQQEITALSRSVEEFIDSEYSEPGEMP